MFENLCIQNLRLFNDLSIEELKRINLFAGRNNSGKTTVLEAMFLLAGGRTPHLPRRLKRSRGLTSLKSLLPPTYSSALFFGLDMQRRIVVSGSNTHLRHMALTIEPERRSTFEDPAVHRPPDRNPEQSLRDETQAMPLFGPGEELEEPWGLGFHWVRRSTGEGDWVSLGGIHVMSSKLDSRAGDQSIPWLATFLSPSSGNGRDDAVSLARLRTRKEDSQITNALRSMEPRLRAIEDSMSSGTPMIWADVGLSEFVPLSATGGGMTRLARILLAMSNIRGGVLLVDEIDNGIHHAAMKDVWAAVAKASHEFDVQVLATTHSFECLIAAHEAMGDGMDEFRFHRLDQGADGSRRCVTFDEANVDAAIHHGLEVR